MIYLNNENIIIPNINNDVVPTNFKIVLQNNVTNEVFNFDVTNTSENELYYSFNVNTDDLTNNEYTLSLLCINAVNNEEICIGKCLAQKGINKAYNIVHNSNNEYIQFE